MADANTAAVDVTPEPSTIDAMKHDSALSAAASGALLHSPLGRLPAEIRNTIYTLTLQQPHGFQYGHRSWTPLHDGTSISQALSITVTCKQIHAETKLMRFALNDITIIPHDTRSPTAQFDLAVRSLNKIPLTWISPSSRVVLRATYCGNVPYELVSHFARNLRHFRIFLSVKLSAHRWGGDWDAGSGNYTHNRTICIRDTPASMNDCGSLILVFPLDGCTTALVSVEDVHRTKVALVKTHRTHRLYPIKHESEKLLQGYGLARVEMINMVKEAYERLK